MGEPDRSAPNRVSPATRVLPEDFRSQLTSGGRGMCPLPDHRCVIAVNRPDDVWIPALKTTHCQCP
jgi:hypothetical protein